MMAAARRPAPSEPGKSQFAHPMARGVNRRDEGRNRLLHVDVASEGIHARHRSSDVAGSEATAARASATTAFE